MVCLCSLDLAGYVFAGSNNRMLQITDVTAVAESDDPQGDRNVFSEKDLPKISLFPPPYSYLAVVMQRTA